MNEWQQEPWQEDPLFQEPKKKFNIKTSDLVFLAVCIVFIAAVFIFRGWWRNHYGGVIVVGSSMRETLHDQDELFVRYSLDGTEAQRGDVIVVYVGDYEECADMQGKYIIKRLIAIEGDKVRCTDGQVEICYAGTQEYVPLDEPYAYYGDYREEYDFAEYELKENEIFFLGDNRSQKGSSIDSRYQENQSHLNYLYQEKDIFGVVPQWAIECKSICKIFI